MKLTARERAFAESAALATRIKPVRRALVGPRDPRQTWLDFHVARSTIDEVNWKTFEGAPDAGRVRAAWPIGILAVSFEQTVSAVADESEGTRLGFAFNTRSLGRAVLVGLIPHRHEPPIEAPFVAGVGIGPEDLNAGLVAVRLDRTLVNISKDQSLAAAGIFDMHDRYSSIDALPDGLPRIPLY